jgi:hypothetical protein
MEDDLNIMENGTRPQFFGKIEDNLNLKVIGRQPPFQSKWKTTTGKVGLASPNFS